MSTSSRMTRPIAPDLPTLVAQCLTSILFGQSWAGLTPDAKTSALYTARAILSDIEPLILDEAVMRARPVLPDDPRAAERIEQAVRGIA